MHVFPPKRCASFLIKDVHLSKIKPYSNKIKPCFSKLKPYFSEIKRRVIKLKQRFSKNKFLKKFLAFFLCLYYLCFGLHFVIQLKVRCQHFKLRHNGYEKYYLFYSFSVYIFFFIFSGSNS